MYFKGKKYCKSMNGVRATLVFLFPYMYLCPNMSLSFEFESPINTPILLHLDVPASFCIYVVLNEFDSLQEGNLKKVKQGDVVASLHKLEVSDNNYIIIEKIISITQCLTYANLKSDCLCSFGGMTYLQGVGTVDLLRYSTHNP